MMSKGLAPTLPEKMTVDEFLVWAADKPGGYELYAGHVYAMAPERAGHAKVKFAVQTELKRAIAAARLPCHMLPDGMTVRVADDTAHLRKRARRILRVALGADACRALQLASLGLFALLSFRRLYVQRTASSLLLVAMLLAGGAFFHARLMPAEMAIAALSGSAL